MRILHIDETFHPSYGYQVNPLAKFQQKQGNEVYILTPTKEYLYPVYREFGDDGSDLEKEDLVYEKATGVKIIRVPAKGYLLRRLVYGKEVFSTVDKVFPDVIFVHCVETLTAIRFLLRRPKYPMVFDSHMLSMASGNRFAKIYEFFYKQWIARIIKRKKYNVIRTQDDDYVNTHLGIPFEQTPFISFGTDTILFCPSEIEKKKFRKDNGIDEDAFVVVYTGKLTPAKGGQLLADAFLEKFDGKVVLVCVGTPPDDEYGKKVQKTLNMSENKVLMFPTQNYLELARFYQQADLSVFPRQCSMSFYDAQACGIPVLSEDNNVNIERCKHGNGVNFISGDISDLRLKIQQMANIDKKEYQKMKNAARAYIENGYDYRNIAERYTEYLKKAIQMFAEN